VVVRNGNSDASTSPSLITRSAVILVLYRAHPMNCTRVDTALVRAKTYSKLGYVVGDQEGLTITTSMRIALASGIIITRMAAN